MILLRLLNPQGIAGIAASIALAVLLLVQKGETRHWRKSSDQYEQLYRGEQAAFATTVANARAAADQARAADKANADRVAADQRSINERTVNDFEARLAAARSAAQRLRLQPQAAGDPGARRSPSMPRLSTPAGGAPEAARENGLLGSDALTATEQAIQLDELIKWTRAQAAVDNNPKAVASHPGD